MLKEFIEDFELGKITNNVCFSKYLTIKTKGIIKNLIEPNSIESLRIILRHLNSYNKKYLILGKGSNIITTDETVIDNVILTTSLPKFLNISNDFIEVSASYFLPKLASELAEKNLGNLEFLSGIPGTVGGAIAMNAGAYKKEIKDYLLQVYCINKKGDYIILKNNNLNFSYRSSIFKNKNDLIILKCIFKVKKTNIDIKSKILEWKEYRKNTQPLDQPNCGSIFKNETDYYAWEIIDKLGLRGYQIGGAMFSEKHSNFIINYNNASGNDIKKLIDLAKNEALSKLNINLKEEIIILE